MPLLRYLWAAMKRPKDGANFSWQLNAAPDGCSSQCWNYSPDRAANKPISPPCSTTKEVIFFWLPAMQLERLATELMENKQPLPHAQLLFPSFSSYSRFLNEPDVFHIHGKNIFRYDSLRKKFLEEQQCSAFQIKQGNKHEARKGNHTHGCSSGYCFKLHKDPSRSQVSVLSALSSLRHNPQSAADIEMCVSVCHCKGES